MKARVLVGALAALVLVGSANAAILFDDFESYADQAAFEAAWPKTATNSLPLVQALGFSGTQSVSTQAAANWDFRNYRNITPTAASDAAPLEFSFMILLGDPANTGARNYCEIRAYENDAYNAGGLQQLVAMGVYNSPSPTTQWSFRSTFGGDNWQQGSIARSAGWHELKAVITTGKVDYFVDGAPAHSSALNTDGLLFDSVVLGSGLTSNGMDALVDDISVVPEPATLALLGLGGLFLRRRR